MINVLDIPEPGGIADPFQLGLLLPVPGPEANTILLEDRDGKDIQRLTATAVDFNAAGRTAFRDQRVSIDVLITDARVAIACSRYDKGDGWFFFGGGSAMALEALFTGVSKARAAVRSRGKMLVGQVRYPWIQRVGGSSNTVRTRDEELILETSAGTGGAMRTTLTLSKGLRAEEAVSEIVRRAARYRLASEDLAADASRWLATLAAATPDGASAADARGLRFFRFPDPKRVNEESARLTPRTAGGES